MIQIGIRWELIFVQFSTICLLQSNFPTCATSPLTSINRLSVCGVSVTKRVIDGNLVKLAIWDTAGQEKFHAINRYYYRGAKGVICMYDVTNRKSFEKLNYWMQEAYDHCDDDITIMIVANKIDLVRKCNEL